MTIKSSPFRVLVVDDEPLVARVLAASLETLHNALTVEIAHSFAEALYHVQQTQYELLIADYKMPGLNGLDLIQAVHGISPDTRLVLMTAYGSPQLRETVDLLGLFGYLEKPFTLTQVRELFQPLTGESVVARRVLLLDNNDDSRSLYQSALWRAGYKVYEASSLPLARDLISHCHFDAFMCELDGAGMSTMNLLGDQITRLRKDGTHIIVIASQRGYRPICEDLGIEFLLETPVATDALVTLLDRLTASSPRQASPVEE